ncbi:MAG: non-homologous end-joining DNA ligase [Actinomycetota bacterium]|nr:non-homologous end-joining DNA ligase [Actinomycetota bacterium]
MTHIEVAGRTLELSSLEKVLWPEAGFTKGDMLEYYRRIAPALLPHVAGRPVTLGRFPDGVDRYGWYQTNCRGNPEWIATRRVGTQDYCVLEDSAGLLWAANMGAVELHPLLGRAAEVDEPTVVVFDLDPGGPASILDCCRVALLVREWLTGAGLESFVKTSGSLGVHVYVPVNARVTYDQTKAFARRVAEELAESDPDRIVAKPARKLRAGKVLVDWGQNVATRSMIAPYSLRGTAWPLVSAPVSWNEVEAAAARGEPSSVTFAPSEVLARVERSGDLFAPVTSLVQPLPC